ncbi:ThuA domain-containing protein [Modicisalibacter luteus]|uniref:ThuA domain-containing protein n=1 Tax=Modicisalibacter luteus TaxID=453962 RepID=A0ABV7M1G9_9GAMM|nr:trehalose utilization protein ThuA [Halomonas lutea]GHB08251.1 trehalose utilization protein ThuA [Halomonas lutea]
MTIRVLVWGENVHEQDDAEVARLYPQGMHGCIAAGLGEDPEIQARTTTLQEPEHGLTQDALDSTDVLVWWGHVAHDRVAESVVERVHARVLEGMGLVVLHSGHFSRIFKRLMGTTCSLGRWREDGERERLWVVDPAHPIVQGIGECIELPQAEMYGEPFAVPKPDEVVFVSAFEGGEAFRSGLTYQRGGGRIFYFRPGHETFPIYHDVAIRRVLKNAVRWTGWRDVSGH